MDQESAINVYTIHILLYIMCHPSINGFSISPLLAQETGCFFDHFYISRELLKPQKS